MFRFFFRLIFAACFLSFVLGFASPASAVVRPLAFPVEAPYTFRDDYLDPRGGGTRRHLGNDIIADKMKKIYSTVDGYVTFVVSPEAVWGYAIEIKDSDGYSYSFLHLNNDTPGTDDGKGGEANAYAPGIANGARVSKGQHIGWVGDSGNAESTVPHLHFEIENPNGENINPYESLLASAGLTVAPEPTVIVEHAEIPAIDFDPVYRDAITRELSLNSRGRMVQLLQTKLKDMGYYTSAYITDYYDSITRDAVMRLQRANGIEATGIVDYRTRLVLNKGTGFSEPAPPEPIAGKSSDPAILQEGSSGAAVTELQVNLKNLGYYTSSLITGYFGPITKEALTRFQSANGIQATGVADLKTRTAIASAISSGKTLRFRSDLKIGMRGQEVIELQVELKKLGYYTSSYITGEFDSLTQDAVIRYQRAKGITPTGTVGPITRSALNFGSVPVSVLVSVPVVAASSSPYVFTQALESGSRGEEVIRLQLKLKNLGYFANDATGYFGSLTKTAVVRFQTSNGIEATGTVGPKTRAKLNGK